MKVVIFVSLPQLLKGNSTNSTQESVYTGLGVYFCICERSSESSIKPFVRLSYTVNAVHLHEYDVRRVTAVRVCVILC